MRAAVKKARGVAAPKTPPKAKPVAGPKTLPKAMPKTPPKAATRVAPGKPQVKAMPKNVGSKPEIDLTYTWSAWVLDLALLKPPLASGRQGKGASFSWQGFRCGRQWTSSRRALQVCCFPHGPESRGGDPSGCSADDLCSSLQPRAL